MKILRDNYPRRANDFVIPAQAGIQRDTTGFRVPLRGPGMTKRENWLRPEVAP
jgi:hypothetical protein